MMKYLITLLIGSLNSFSFGMYEKYSIIQINTFSENKVTSVFNSEGGIIEASDLDFGQLNGYPAIERDWDGPRIAYHTGRFLAKYEDDYCLIDTNCRIIIDFCDTIESIFLAPAIYEREKCDVFLEYLNYGQDVYYQAIRNGATFLYANSGEKIFATSYSGLLLNDQYLQAAANYYYTCNFDYSAFGLLDKSGTTLLANDFGRLIYPYQSNSDYFISFQTGVFNAATKSWEIFDSTGFSHWLICSDLYLVHANEKYGLFDIVEGVIVSAEYDTIIFPANCDYCQSGIKPKPLILKRENHIKAWHLPKKYWAAIEENN